MTHTERYLESLRCTLWPGVSFDLTDPKERLKAAEWLKRTVGELWLTPQK